MLCSPCTRALLTFDSKHARRPTLSSLARSRRLWASRLAGGGAPRRVTLRGSRVPLSHTQKNDISDTTPAPAARPRPAGGERREAAGRRGARAPAGPGTRLLAGAVVSHTGAHTARLTAELAIEYKQLTQIGMYTVDSPCLCSDRTQRGGSTKLDFMAGRSPSEKSEDARRH